MVELSVLWGWRFTSCLCSMRVWQLHGLCPMHGAPTPSQRYRNMTFCHVNLVLFQFLMKLRQSAQIILHNQAPVHIVVVS